MQSLRFRTRFPEFQYVSTTSEIGTTRFCHDYIHLIFRLRGNGANHTTHTPRDNGNTFSKFGERRPLQNSQTCISGLPMRLLNHFKESKSSLYLAPKMRMISTLIPPQTPSSLSSSTTIPNTKSWLHLQDKLLVLQNRFESRTPGLFLSLDMNMGMASLTSITDFFVDTLTVAPIAA